MSELKVGDSVQLISGGPIMAISKLGTRKGKPIVICTWFANGKTTKEGFTPATLQLTK